MKKYFLLVALIAISVCVQAQKKVTIGVLTDESSEVSREMFSQLQKEIKAVVGRDANVVFGEVLENKFNVARAKANYQELVNNNTDIILAFGVVNTIAIHTEENYPKPVIVFGTVNNDFMDLSENQKTSNINNITYIIAPISYAKDLEAFKSLFDYKKAGIVVDDFLVDALPLKELFDAYFSDKEASYKLIPVASGMDITASLNDVDAVYSTVGFHYSDAEFGKLVSAINQKKLPSFSSFSKKDVERGILATIQPEANINQFFRRIALDVEAIISGTNPSDLPLFLNYKSKLSINIGTATQIGFPIRYSMLATADLIGEEVAVSSESSLSILDIMNAIVGKNLSLAAEQKNVELAGQDVKTAKSNYLPDVIANVGGTYIDPRVAEFSGGQNPEMSTAGSILLKQLIYSESASAGTAIQKSKNKAQEETYNAAELDAVLNATVAYFNALILKTNASLLNENLQVTKQNLEFAEQNFEAGASGKSDVLRFRSQLAQDTQNLIDAGNQLQQAYFTINQLMNEDISNKITIEDAEIGSGSFVNNDYESLMLLLDNPQLQPLLIDFFVVEAKENAPELKNIGYNLDAVARNYRLNDGGRFIPTVALQGQYNLGLSQSGKGSVFPVGSPNIPDGTYNVGLNLSLPIFQQNQRNINRQSAKIQEDQLLIQKENTAQNIEANIYAIVLDITGNIANIEISKIAEETAKESLELTQNAYQQGAVPVIQLIDAQTNYLQAQLGSATANYNYLLTSMELERAIGHFSLMNSETDNQAFEQRAQQFILNNN